MLATIFRVLRFCQRLLMSWNQFFSETDTNTFERFKRQIKHLSYCINQLECECATEFDYNHGFRCQSVVGDLGAFEFKYTQKHISQ